MERNYEKDYVDFVYDGSSAYSDYCGRKGGRQIIALWKNVSPGTVAHELIHVLGFNHEQCRSDRDGYIKIAPCKLEDYQYEVRGIPLGPFDPESIMMYGGDEITSDIPGFATKMGQRSKLSVTDVNGINYVYSDEPTCSYDAFGNAFWKQQWYECKDCWGESSDYGCCRVCMLKCHKGHNTIEHQGNFVCDCGRYRHDRDSCTKKSTGTKAVKQPFYDCVDCLYQKTWSQSHSGRLGVCLACARQCHKGHDLRNYRISSGYCDCGTKWCKSSCYC